MVAQSCLYSLIFHLVLQFFATIMKFWEWQLKKAFLFLSLSWWDSKKKNTESYAKEKVRYSFPKNVKFHFCPAFRLINTILSTISLSDLCMKMMWPQVDFCSGDIYITLSFRVIKKILKILPMWDFVPLKCRQNMEILQLVWILTTNKF